MSRIGALLAKYKGRIQKTAASSGGQLPEGNYLGVITKGEVKDSQESDARTVVFQVKVLEGELKGQAGSVRQNIIKGDGDLNEVGVGIVKRMLQDMFGKKEPGIEDGSKWEQLLARSVGFRLKFRVKAQENSDYMNTSVQAVLKKADAADEPADEPTEEGNDVSSSPEVEAKVKEMEEEEEEETTEAESTEDGITPAKLKAMLKKMNRDELKQFIREQSLKDSVKVMKSHTEDDIRANIIKALAPAEEEE